MTLVSALCRQLEHSLKSALKRIDSGWSEININIFYRNIYTIYVTCGQISNLFVQALETGRNVMSKSQTLLSNCLRSSIKLLMYIVLYSEFVLY
jgi:uncharacterized protein YgbK (DUF1537 family)